MIKTRLAPSPTGWFHIGTARTALFNWLYARHCGGQFLLRMEDTDKERSRSIYHDDIIAGLKWLGLNWDSEIVYQSQRDSIYQKHISKLLDSGQVYKKDGAIYFKIDKLKIENSAIAYTDLIRGEIKTSLDNIDDFVIVKTDGAPLFLLTNIIDDVEMGITHVLRGEEHISNTPRQLLIAVALNLQPPQYAHIPLILNPDRTKMSKRSPQPTAVKEYIPEYIPQAMINFLALLGWHEKKSEIRNPKSETNHKSQITNVKTKEKEVYTIDELVNAFDLNGIQKSPAIFDQQKLDWLNSFYIKNQSIPSTGLPSRTTGQKSKIWEIVKERMTKLSDCEKLTKEILQPAVYTKELLVFKKSTIEYTARGLQKALEKLANLPPAAWEKRQQLQAALEQVVQENKLSNGDVFWPVRVALSGRPASPSPVELLWALGRRESLDRIRKGLVKI